MDYLDEILTEVQEKITQPTSLSDEFKDQLNIINLQKEIKKHEITKKKLLVDSEILIAQTNEQNLVYNASLTISLDNVLNDYEALPLRLFDTNSSIETKDLPFTLVKGSLSLCFAYTNSGKTLFAKTIFYEALKNKIPTLYISPETDFNNILNKIAKVIKMEDEDTQNEIKSFYSSGKNVLNDKITDKDIIIKIITNYIESHKNEENILIIIDYLQIIQSFNLPSYQVLRNLAILLQNICNVNKNVSIFCLSQAKNKQYQVEDYKSRISGSYQMCESFQEIYELQRDSNNNTFLVNFKSKRNYLIQNNLNKKMKIYFNPIKDMFQGQPVAPEIMNSYYEEIQCYNNNFKFIDDEETLS